MAHSTVILCNAAIDEAGDLSSTAASIPNDKVLKKLKCPDFVRLNLNFELLKGIVKLGYNKPTPVQRMSIPHILSGRDVVVEARTGSGKTAAYLLPMLQRLQKRSLSGTRALILVPTKELAEQVKNMCYSLSHFLHISMAVLVGEIALEEHFAALHAKPDIIIATPGRLLHLTVEMDLHFSSVQMVVLDEGDRLMELGCLNELTELFNRLPPARQTLIFSATLPKVLVQFAQTGLHNLKHISLESDKRLSENLRIHHLYVIPSEKTALLTYLLKEVISKEEMTLVFLPTKLQVDFTYLMMQQLGVKCTYIHSGLDCEARQLHMRHFTSRRVLILLATDVAARGLDIPLLDNVINWNFPENSRLFVHRAGRVARAGRSGTLYNLVSCDELSLMLRVLQELGRPLHAVKNPYALVSKEASTSTPSTPLSTDQLGRVPDRLLTSYVESCSSKVNQVADLASLVTPCENAYKKAKSLEKKRATAQGMCISQSVVLQARQMQEQCSKMQVGYHPIFEERMRVHEDWEKVCFQMHNFKPKYSCLERDAKNNPALMQSLKSLEADVERTRLKRHHREMMASGSATLGPEEMAKRNSAFVPYVASAKNSLDKSAFDVRADDVETEAKRSKMEWNAKKHKFMMSGSQQQQGKKDTILTKSGVRLPASYQTGRYSKWLKHNSSNDFSTEAGKVLGFRKRNFHTKTAEEQKGDKKWQNAPGPKGRQVKKMEVIVSQLKKKSKIKAIQKANRIENKKRRGKK